MDRAAAVASFLGFLFSTMHRDRGPGTPCPVTQRDFETCLGLFPGCVPQRVDSAIVDTCLRLRGGQMVAVYRACTCRWGWGAPRVHWGSLWYRTLTVVDSLCIWLLEMTKSMLNYWMCLSHTISAAYGNVRSLKVSLPVWQRGLGEVDSTSGLFPPRLFLASVQPHQRRTACIVSFTQTRFLGWASVSLADALWGFAGTLAQYRKDSSLHRGLFQSSRFISSLGWRFSK